ncbi:MAG: FtsQ-type POTRA domain-containing protein [Cyanobacteria bacterium P01_H01_bin.121]
MTDFTPVSAADLANRRKRLKRQRQIKVVLSVWRTLLVSGLAIGLGWAITRPLLLIRGPEQVNIDGNAFLSTETLRSLLPLQYPASLFQIRPEALATVLETQAPIAKATVDRQLFPPQLMIEVQERRPVAQVVSAGPSNVQVDRLGFVDAKGLWIPVEILTQLDPELALPTLIVRGFKPKHQADWPLVYQAIQASPIEITEIDWQDPSNLVLQTELGPVHFGGKHQILLTKQLSVLDQMRNLSQDPEFDNVEFIDLRDPDNPTLRVKQPVAAIAVSQEQNPQAQSSETAPMTTATESANQ